MKRAVIVFTQFLSDIIVLELWHKTQKAVGNKLKRSDPLGDVPIAGEPFRSSNDPIKGE